MDSFVDNKNINIEKPKIGIMDIFMTSLIRTKELATTSVNSSSKFVQYVIFISLFVALIVFGVPSASAIASFGGFNNLFTNTMPAFEMKNGKLTADQKFEMKVSNATILIDTDLDAYRFGDFENEGIYIAIGSRYTKLIQITDIEDDSAYTEFYSYDNTWIFPDGFNNKMLYNMTPVFYFMLLITFGIYAVTVASKYLLLALIYTVVSRSLTAISKLPMTFSDAFRLCFYSQTISIILVNVNSAIGYYIPSIFMSIIGVIITIVIIHKAMGPHMPDIDDILKYHDDNKDSK